MVIGKGKHSSSIRKYLKIGGTDSTFFGVGGFGPPRGGRWSDLKKFEKAPYTTVVRTPHSQNYSNVAQLESV